MIKQNEELLALLQKAKKLSVEAADALLALCAEKNPGRSPRAINQDIHNLKRTIDQSIINLKGKRHKSASQRKISVEWKGEVLSFNISQRTYDLVCRSVDKKNSAQLERLYQGVCRVTNGKPTEEALIEYLNIFYKTQKR